MGKPRVRGSHAKILVYTDPSKPATEVGEISKFSVKELGEVKKSRSMGEQQVTANKTFEGYDLSFEGGKVDWRLATLLHANDDAIVAGNKVAMFSILQEINYYGDKVEKYRYDNVVLYGYNLDMDANDEMMEKFEGFCGTLRVPVAGTTPEIDAETAKTEALIRKILEEQNKKA